MGVARIFGLGFSISVNSREMDSVKGRDNHHAVGFCLLYRSTICQARSSCFRV